MERVGFGRRLAAFLIDVVILMGPLVIVGFSFQEEVSVGNRTRLRMSETGTLLAGLISLAYFSTEIFKAATPGKLILGIRIGNEQGGTAPASMLTTRYLIKTSGTSLQILAVLTGLSFIGLLRLIVGLILLIGLFFIFTARRQGFHDMIAKTAVFPTGAPAAPQSAP
jgi:uncharacterized RDD family membrane protein YckC